MQKVRFMLPILLLLVACTPVRSGLQVAGSTSVQPLAEMLAEAYNRAGYGQIRVQGGGSTAGALAVLHGLAGVGIMSRPLTEDESAQGLVAHIIGYDLLTVVVHPTNPLSGVTAAQLGRLFSGAAADWRDVGGRPGRVCLVSREAGSGSRAAFRTLVGPIDRRALVQSSAGAIRVAVMADPQAVGYVSLGVARMGGLKVLAVDGRKPDEPGYALTRPILFVTRGTATGDAAAFIRFAGSPAGLALIREEGLVPVDHGP